MSKQDATPKASEVVSLLSAQLPQRYDPETVQTGLAMWDSFHYHARPALIDVEQSAAAIEWLVIATHGFSRGLQDLCRHYNVSLTAVQSLFESMVQMLEIPPEDLWPEVEEWEDDWEEKWDEEEVDLGMSPEDFLDVFESLMNPGDELPQLEWTLPTSLDELGLNLLTEVPQLPKTWLGGIFSLDQWIMEPFPHRPRLVLWLEQETELVLGYRVLEMDEDVSHVLQSLLHVILQPEMGEPSLPKTLFLANESLVGPLATLFSSIDIKIKQGGEEVLSDIVELMNAHLSSSSGDEYDVTMEPGYLEGGRFEPELLAAFFAEASRFYSLEPWDQPLVQQSFLLHLGDSGLESRVVTLSGSESQDFQLILYDDQESRDLLQSMTAATEALQIPPVIPSVSFLRLLFVERHNLPEAFVQEVEQHQWRLDDGGMLPFLGFYNTLRGEELLRPWDYHVSIACLRLLQEWNKDHTQTAIELEVADLPFEGPLRLERFEP